ncbi:MAG: hypothetical protein CL534_06135 [Ahrensia sp.]|nr:hypothetical protein [Ahrensia sp.]
MKNNRVGVWLFLLALIAVGVASTGEVSERINMWLGKQAEPVMAEGETAGDTEATAAPEEAADTQAAETEEAAAPSEEDMTETPSDGEAAEVAATPETEASETGGEQAAAPDAGAGEEAGSDAEAAAPAAETAEPQAEAAAAPTANDEAEAQAEVIVPSFGLLRVEPDGSTLIAGSAGPNADIEILTRSETIATTKAEANGDFVAVLDDPLDPGDYEIVLRATEENGDVAMSEETAIVSVPEPGREGELLALVERPGAPSRLINTPEPEEAAAAETPQDDMAEAETPAAETETAMAEPAAEEATQEAAGAEAAESEAQPSMEEAETASADAAEGAADGDVTEVAEASGETAAETPAPSSDAARITIRIEAVEIDSDTIFVAGAADPGSQVRVYANEFLLGDTLTSPGGRFLVQVRKDLAVGDYIIRADVIDPATAEVVARAAVPFTRSEGERVAAVADNAAAAEQPAPASETAELAGSAPQAEAATPAAAPSSDQAQTETMPEAEPEAEASTVMADTPAASGEAETGEPDMAEAEQPAAAETGEAASGEASAEPAMTEETEAGEMATADAETPAGEPAAEAAEASAPAPETAEAPSADASEGAGEQVASAPETSAPPEVSEDITVTGKLRQTNSSVIIRRGDTLWHISRRVYGQGTRFTTIYLANQDQIKDPDMIWPGQIFELPEAAEPEN